MPDTKPKTRNAKSPLTLGQALDRGRERKSTYVQRRNEVTRAFDESEAEWFVALVTRVSPADAPELKQMLGIVDGVRAPDLNAALDALAAEGPPDDAEPVYTAERMQQGLTPERLAVARGSR